LGNSSLRKGFDFLVTLPPLSATVLPSGHVFSDFAALPPLMRRRLHLRSPPRGPFCLFNRPPHVFLVGSSNFSCEGPGGREVQSLGCWVREFRVFRLVFFFLLSADPRFSFLDGRDLLVLRPFCCGRLSNLFRLVSFSECFFFRLLSV